MASSSSSSSSQSSRRLDDLSDSRDDMDEEQSWILPTELIEDNSDNDDNNNMVAAEEDISQRRNQVAETLEEKVCRFFVQLNTTDAPPENKDYDLFNGVVFRLRTKNVGIEIKSLELDLTNFESSEVKVFTKLGEFNETTGIVAEMEMEEWEEVTKPMAFAVATAERKNSIIPTEEFNTITMEPKESRLIYVALPSETPLVKSNSSDITAFDQVYSRNNELVTHVGFGVRGSEPFGKDLVENRPFHGIVHYETKLPCEDQRAAFAMELDYFVDTADPRPIVTSLTNNAISKAVEHAMSRDAKLIRMQNIGGLRYQSTSTETTAVPHEGPCPFNWEECSKVVVRVQFGHDDRLNPGIAQFEILKYANDFNVSEYPFDLGYVGKIPLSLDYFIYLAGAPKSFELDELQEGYYGTQTARFLSEVTGEEILAAGFAPGKRNVPTSGGGSSSRSSSGLRDNGRSLQSTVAKVHTSIYGAYPAWPEPQHPHSIRGVDSMATVEILQSAFDENGTLYAQYLTDGLLRPGPIHEGERQDFFSGILGADAELDESSLWMPTSAPTQTPTLDPDAEPEVWGMPQSTLQILSILMLVVGLVCLVANCYSDHQNRQEAKEKLKRNARAAQRKVDKLRAEQYRRIARKKKKIQSTGSSDDDSMYEPMIA